VHMARFFARLEAVAAELGATGTVLPRR
jgi:hypothetical protein